MSRRLRPLRQDDQRQSLSGPCQPLVDRVESQIGAAAAIASPVLVDENASARRNKRSAALSSRGRIMSSNRVLVCILGGAIAAVFCFSGGRILFGPPSAPAEEIAAAVANRLLLGFVIGVSGWRLPHLVHGAILGLLVSLSVSIGFIARPFEFFAYTGAGVIYGICIEWLATDLFRAPMKA
jgi:hypothetical protein